MLYICTCISEALRWAQLYEEIAFAIPIHSDVGSFAFTVMSVESEAARARNSTGQDLFALCCSLRQKVIPQIASELTTSGPVSMVTFWTLS